MGIAKELINNIHMNGKRIKESNKTAGYLLTVVVLVWSFSVLLVSILGTWTVRAEDTAASTEGISSAPWCSALYGILQEELGVNPPGNAIPDLNSDGYADASDLSALASWHGQSNDEACYGQIDKNLNCENYLAINWCQGLRQGIADSLGSTAEDGRYWYPYDLNDDNYIDASDLSYIAMYIGEDNQQACFDRFPLELVCSQCGNGIVESDEVCDGSELQECMVGAYRGLQICNLPNLTGHSPFCVWSSCQAVEYCGDDLVNGEEECDGGPNGSDFCTSDCRLVDLTGGSNNNNSNAPQSVPNDSDGGSGSLAPLSIPNNDVSTPSSDEDLPVSLDSSADQTSQPQVLGIKVEEEENLTNWRNIGPQWWDQDVADQSQFPDGSLLRGWSPAVYHLENGKARHIKTLSELVSSFFGQRIFNVQEWVLDLYR